MKLLSVHVLPSYGKSSAIVRWTPDQELAAMAPVYHVYRSPDGAGDWELVNEAPESGTELLDTKFHFSVVHRVPHYRVLTILPGGELIHGTAVGLYAALTRLEYGACHLFLVNHLRMQRVEGLPMYHFIPKTRGTVSKNWSEHDQQSQRCEDVDEQSYGLKYVGGYRRPYRTLATLRTAAPRTTEEAPDGSGERRSRITQATLLAFPQPEPGHLLVNPASDDRYVVTSPVLPHKFRGIYPICFRTQLELLPRNHPAYLVPLPDDPIEVTL